MSLSVAVIDALLATGATREQIAAAMKADIAERDAIEQAKQEKKRAGNRARQQRKREKDNACNAVSRVTAVTERDAPPSGSPKDNNQTPSLPPAEASEPNGSSPQPRPWSLPAGVSLQVWSDFLGNRKRKRLGNTPTAWKGFQDDLARVALRTGIPPPKLIEHAAAKGWGSINEPTESMRNERTGDPTTSALQRIIGAAHH